MLNSKTKDGKMNNKKHVTFCFGRLNPPHYGHSSLIQAVSKDAKHHGGDWFIFTSKSHDKSVNPKNKNPIPYSEKVQWIDLINPGLGKHFVRDSGIAKTFLEAAAYLYSLGYTSATFVAGDEDMPIMKPTLVQYNHQERDAKGNPHRHGFYAFHPFLFHANPRVTRATSARQAAIDNDADAFFAATQVPKEWTVNGKTLMQAVRAGLVAELPEPEEEPVVEPKAKPKALEPEKQLNTTPHREIKMKNGPAKELAEAMKNKQEAPKPRNFVAKNAIQSGAGAHKDKKKAMKQGDAKHKGKLEFAEGRLGSLLNNMFEERYQQLYEAEKIPASHESATPGMSSHPNLDNSSPYAPWRFAAHFLAGANGKDPYDHKPERNGPNGQHLVTVAYSSEEDTMIRQAEKAFGAEARRQAISGPGSNELSDTYTTSPVAKPKRNKYGI